MPTSQDATANAWMLASYNIRSCRGLDRCTDPSRIATIIRELGASIVALQEVASQLGQSNDTRQLDLLAASTDLDAVAGPTLLRSDSPCGTALLTRYPALRVRRFDLSVSGREPRGALDVDLDLNGTVLRVVNIHLGLRVKERRAQVARLLASLPATDDQFTLLTGDFNEWWPFSSTLREIRTCFRAAPTPPTFPSVLPLLALDRIWMRGSTQFEIDVRTYRTPLTRIASDHLPLVATPRLVKTRPS